MFLSVSRSQIFRVLTEVEKRKFSWLSTQKIYPPCASLIFPTHSNFTFPFGGMVPIPNESSQGEVKLKLVF